MSAFRCCIRLICAGCAVFLFGALLNGIVYATNDFDMPVLISGPEQVMVPSESECLWSGVGTYKSHTQTYRDTTVNFPYLADWIYIDQRLVYFDSWPKPFRFFMRTVACFSEGTGFASPGDILMWGSMVSLFPLFIFLGVLGLFRFLRRLWNPR